MCFLSALSCFYSPFPIALHVKDPNGIKLFDEAFWAILGTLVIFYVCFSKNIFLFFFFFFFLFCNSIFVFLTLHLYKYIEYIIKSTNQSTKITHKKSVSIFMIL